MRDDLLIGDVADRLGLQTWRVRRLIDRKLVPEPRKLGRMSVFSPADLPVIREAAMRAGYLRPTAAMAVGA